MKRGDRVASPPADREHDRQEQLHDVDLADALDQADSRRLLPV